LELVALAPFMIRVIGYTAISFEFSLLERFVPQALPSIVALIFVATTWRGQPDRGVEERTGLVGDSGESQGARN
jgi:hypothetical protein